MLTSTCAGARCGRPTTVCTMPATTSGRCGPRRTVPCTHGTACRRCSTTTPGICRRASSQPSPDSTPRTCAAPRAPAPPCSPRSASPPPDGTRPTCRRRWLATSPARSPGVAAARNYLTGRAVRACRCGTSLAHQSGLGLTADGGVVLGQLPQEAGYPAGAEVVVARPSGLDGDPGHLLVQHPYVCLELAGLLVVHGLGGRGEVLIRDAVDDLDGGHSANLEGTAGRPVVGIDGQRDVRAGGQGADLGRDGHGADDDPCAVPVEPDGDHPGKAVGPGVGQPGQCVGGEQLLSAGVGQLPGEGVGVAVRGFVGAHPFLLLTAHAARSYFPEGTD